MKKRFFLLTGLAVLIAAALLAGCMPSQTEPEAPNATEPAANSGQKPVLPDKLTLQNGVPQLVVYDVDGDEYEQMDIESYVAGVLAGEMRNDWPMEALKAQAILARTFVLKFVEEKDSRYTGADVSTDIREAQAYDEDKINDRILKAVEETKGLVMSADGELPFAWFHAHAGGITEGAVEGLDYEKGEPPYTTSVESADSDKAPTNVKNWTAVFTTEEVGNAAKDAGVKTGTVKTIEIGKKGPSGRAVTFKINGEEVSAPALRLAIGSSKLKSTLIDEITLSGDSVTFKGRGYGHGVGMSQWGAYGMAEEGKDAQQIVKHYFKNVEVVSLWK